MLTRTSTLLVALTAAATVSLTACGSGADPGPGSKSGSGSGSGSSDKLSPSEAVAKVRSSVAAARGAKTFRATADLTEDDKPLDFDLHYGANGVDGSITMNATRLELKVVGTAFYFRAPAGFWKDAGGAQGSLVARTYGGKWVRTANGSTFSKGFKDFSDASSFIGSLTKELEGDAMKRARQVGTGSVGGTPTTTIGDGSGEGTIDVPTSGKPYPLKVVSSASDASSDAGTILFSDWDQPFTVRPPRSSIPLPG